MTSSAVDAWFDHASEAEIHRAIVDWLIINLPDGSVMHHSPNEGRHKVQYRVAQKRLGVRAGWPDIEIFVPRTWWHEDQPWSPLFLEVKARRGRLSAQQKTVRDELVGAGARVGLVRSIDETRDFLAQFITVRLRRG